LARFLESHPNQDPLGRLEDLYKTESDMVYSAAHHAFTYLVQQHGEQAVRAILRAMLPGPKFSEAFAQIIGVRPDDFVAQFKRYARAP